MISTGNTTMLEIWLTIEWVKAVARVIEIYLPPAEILIDKLAVQWIQIYTKSHFHTIHRQEWENRFWINQNATDETFL